MGELADLLLILKRHSCVRSVGSSEGREDERGDTHPQFPEDGGDDDRCGVGSAGGCVGI
jgi:hypothetical protein